MTLREALRNLRRVRREAAIAARTAKRYDSQQRSAGRAQAYETAIELLLLVNQEQQYEVLDRRKLTRLERSLERQALDAPARKS